MKKLFILAFCLLSYLVEGQQQKQNDVKDLGSQNISSLRSSLKDLKQTNKRAVKKVAEVHREELQQQVPCDTVLVGLTYEDSLGIYLSFQPRPDTSAINEPVKKKGNKGFLNFLKKKSKRQ